MRLYHPRTLQILSERKDIPNRYSCSVWSEIFKWKASGKKHPKMFITDDYELGHYLGVVYYCGVKKGCKLDDLKVMNFSDKIRLGFINSKKMIEGEEVPLRF